MEITNDLIEFLYRESPLKDFKSIKLKLKDYIEEKIDTESCPDSEDTQDYTFYKATRIAMENFYIQYYGKPLQVTFHRFDRNKLDLSPMLK